MTNKDRAKSPNIIAKVFAFFIFLSLLSLSMFFIQG